MIRTRAQLVSYRFLTRKTRFGPQVVYMGLVMDKVTVGLVLFRVILYSDVGMQMQMHRTLRFIHIIL